MKTGSVKKLLIIGFALVSLALLWQTLIWAESFALDGIRRASAQNLNLVVENLRGKQEKFRALTRLIAEHPTFKNLLNGTLSADEISTLNLSLEKITAYTDALDIYIMNEKGLTIAASNWNTDKSFIGNNFFYRPYFDQAMQGRLGRFFALGTTSHQRGYYFAYPIRSGLKITGVLAIKMDVGHLESLWWSHDFDIIITDQHGIVFLSTNPDWVFKSLQPLDKELLAKIRSSRQYADMQILPLHVEKGFAFSGAPDLLSFSLIAEGEAQARSQNYLVSSAAMAEANWRIMILARTDSVRPQIIAAAAITGFLLVSLWFLSAFMIERRRRVREQIILQEKVHETLERQVKLRTGDLAQANVKLRTQIVERGRAESELRQAQQDLIQASRLAALGQVSAGLSHELNQPLAAIRSYADNARAYLARNAPQKALSNLSDISELTDRMARIIKHLRTYARKDQVASYPTPIAATLKAELLLQNGRILEENIKIKGNYTQNEVLVMGGEVRLQQVFANLISNAFDAMQDGGEKQLDINLHKKSDHVLVSFHNSGTRIGDKDLTKVFDPFFTTKEVGQGMGLGLSISYGIIKQFGGAIEVANHPRGGVQFTIRLLLAQIDEEA